MARIRIAGRVNVLGYVDSIDEGVAKGWVVDERDGRRGLVVELWLDGRKAAEAVADRRREDLFKFGLDGTAAGFAIPFARNQHEDVGGVLRVVEASTGFVLSPGPLVFDPPEATAPLDVRRLEPRIARRLTATRALADLDAQIESLERLTALGAARADALRRRFAGAGAPAGASLIAFDRPEAPTASIVIAAGESFTSLYECLRALAEQPQQTGYEIILIDDGGEAARTATAVVAGVVWSRTPASFGSAAARKAAAALSRAPYLVFLDAATRATPGWLDALIETFAQGDIGVVAARLLDPDGRVRDCGGAEQGADPKHPTVRYRRDVDFVDAVAFAVRKVLFEQIGGFEERDDLRQRARAAGARTVVQPAASVVCSIEVDPARAAIAPMAPRALFVDDWTPRPDRDAGSHVALQHMLSLQRLGYHVIFAASQSLEDAPGYTPALEALGVEGVYAPYYASIEDALARLAPLDLVYLHRFSNADAYLGACRRLAPAAAVLYNVADLHALRHARAAALGLESGAAVDAAREFSRLVEADAGLVHSSHEAALVRAAAPDANVHCVAWAVAATPTPAPYAARRDIGFLGSYGHAPNADAMRFYARDIMPAFAGEPPLLRMAGSGMTEEIRALANADIRAEGQIADLDGFLSSLRATVAPIRFGAGLKGKVLESLARGTPCVMTSIAAEGLDLPEVLQICVVDGPREIAARLREAIGDEDLWRRLSEAGLAYIRERYSPQRIDDALDAAIASARARRASLVVSS